ncbi:MAG: DNA repair protein RecO C-terminal domain-containing protein [Mucinivorans sp.]
MKKEERPSTIERGVVLHTTKYGERQLIVHLITAHKARASYIANLGARGEARRLFAPLSIIEFAATHGTGDMGKMANVAPLPALFDISSNIVKCTIALFMSELLYRTARVENEAGGELFDFVERSVLELEGLTDPTATANYHLYFMVHLASNLGYAPRMNWGDGMYFDIKAGEFTVYQPSHLLFFNPRASEILYRLLAANHGQSSTLAMSGHERSQFLSLMVDYYSWHTDAIHSVRSVAILSEIFDS